MVYVHLNGKLIDAQQARISPFDHGFLYGDGVYESFRTHHEKIFDFLSHFQRLRHSAEQLDIPFSWSAKQLQKWSEDTYRMNKQEESRVRISISRGENGYNFSGALSPTLLITTSPLVQYQKFKKGVSLTAVHLSRLLPEAKTMSLLPLILGKQASQKANTFDCIFLNENGYITECSVCNIVYRIEKTIFITPKKEALPGTMQRIFLKKAIHYGFCVEEKYSSLRDIQNAEEVIITNSLFGTLPVKTICDKNIKQCPGKLFEKCEIDFRKIYQ